MAETEEVLDIENEEARDTVAEPQENEEKQEKR
jgi:hypothetical protein